MRPSDLRARILLTLGLPASLVAVAPACGGSKPPDAPVSPSSPADGGARVPLAVAPPRPDGTACPPDHAPERICGSTSPATLQQYPFDACPPTANLLRTVTSSRTVAHGGWNGRESVSGGNDDFTFDAQETEDDVARQLQGAPLTRGLYKTTTCCYVHCAPLAVAEASDPVPPGSIRRDVCIPSPRATSVPAQGAPACPRAVRIEGRVLGFTRGRDGECCYDKTAPACQDGEFARSSDGRCIRPMRGRPLRERGLVRLAATTRSEDWAARPARPLRTQADIAASWARAAAAEHSSVAAFARLSLELLALGAPPDLVRDCHQAATEEIDHAARSYAIASRFAGEALGPGPLPMTLTPLPPDVVRLVTETFADGCVAETVAALEAAEALAREEDPDIRRALEVIARDEASHAAFAFRIAAWALREGGASARAALEASVAEAEAEADLTSRRATSGGVHVSFGMLDDASLVAVRARALREVVLPCVHALLAAA
jgi:hypothetical protein